MSSYFDAVAEWDEIAEVPDALGCNVERQLLPCPCCGSVAQFGEVEYDDTAPEETQSDWGGHYIARPNEACGLTSVLMFGEYEGDLRSRWNHRAPTLAAMRKAARRKTDG